MLRENNINLNFLLKSRDDLPGATPTESDQIWQNPTKSNRIRPNPTKFDQIRPNTS